MKQFAGSLRGVASSLFLALIFALCAAGAALGQGVKISSIQVQYTGPETISRARILAQMRTAVGQEYSDAIVEQDIRALYATKQIQNVRIFAQPDGERVKVIVAVQTRANVNEIEIVGAQGMSARSLRKIIKIKINSPLDEDTLGKARQDILDAYRAKGFNDVDVQYRVEADQARGTSRVIFTINEGEKGAISSIRFEGNHHISGYTLRKQMKTKGKTLISFLDKSGRLDEAQLKQDMDSIREWYQDHGYIDVEVGEVRRERVNGRLNSSFRSSKGTSTTLVGSSSKAPR